MRNFFGALALWALTAPAHPGVGIVVDGRGNVFYTDLAHGWKRTPGGKRSIFVRNVHTHELFLDVADNLYGEHLWYEGDATKKWGHHVWCRQTDGQLVKTVPNTEGFLRNYGFVQGLAGSMYWMEDVGEQQAIRSKSPWGQIRTLATGAFGPARWLTATPKGLGYFLKGDVLHRVSADGQLKPVTGHLSRKPAPNYALVGLWTDGAGRVYVANTHDNIVQRVASRGAVSIVAKGSAGWTAPGGTVAPNGDLWLLEYSAANAVRVRCITGGGK